MPQSQTAAIPRHQMEEKKDNLHVQNKQTNAREAHRPAPSSPSEVITVLKRVKKHGDKEQGKILKHEAPCSINHKTTQNKNNTGTTALERSVIYMCMQVFGLLNSKEIKLTLTMLGPPKHKS